MAEYVTKEQVIDWYRPYGHTDEPIPFETLVSDLRDMKAADVAPVRHGRWEVEVGMNFFKERNCPVCKKRIESNFWSFCPNCGALMQDSDA